MSKKDTTPADWPPTRQSGDEMATFAAGCFWSLQLLMDRQPGVKASCAGYVGGSKENPTYEEVCSGRTGHTEAVQVVFDPSEIKYSTLVESVYGKIDPKAKNRSGNDVGTQYRSGVYWHSEEQRSTAELINNSYEGSVVEVAECGHFWPAERYHQAYLENGAGRGAANKQSARKMCNDPIRCYG